MNKKICTLFICALTALCPSCKNVKKYDKSMHNAAFRGELDNLKKCLLSTGNVDILDKDGWSPLFYAVLKRSNYNVVNYLLDNGANVNIIGDNGWTVMYNVVQIGDVKMLDLLISAGIDMKLNREVLHRLLKSGYKHYPEESSVILSRLIKVGASITHEDMDGKTPLDIAKELKLDEAISILAK